MTLEEIQKNYYDTPLKEKKRILGIIKILDNNKLSNSKKSKLIRILNDKLDQEKFSQLINK